MCFRSVTRTIVATVLLGAMLGGCSEYYFDRRDTITLYSGDAVATNRVTQMIDPWPAASGRRNIAYSGEKAATASEQVVALRWQLDEPPDPVEQRHAQLGLQDVEQSGERWQAQIQAGGGSGEAAGIGKGGEGGQVA